MTEKDASHLTSNDRALSYTGKEFVLATDLDGTFLGGREEDKHALYQWIEARRDRVGLIFVTGRDAEFLLELCRHTRVPWPDFVVGDVGTTIAETILDGTGGGRFVPLVPLEVEIAAQWADKGDIVRQVLRDHPGLTLQPTAFRYRVSYDYDPDLFDPAALSLVAELGLDYLISADRYFDVLPKGVSKGPSLKRLLAHLNVPDHRVLTAGDTLNDLSMLQSGLPAVAVGGAEAALLHKVSDLPEVYRADAVGAGGILEAIAALRFQADVPAPSSTAG